MRRKDLLEVVSLTIASSQDQLDPRRPFVQPFKGMIHEVCRLDFESNSHTVSGMNVTEYLASHAEYCWLSGLRIDCLGLWSLFELDVRQL